MANPRRTRYVAPNIVSPDRFGTRIRDPENNRLLPGEVNGQGQPLGAPQPFATGPDPFAARPPMATGATAVTPRTVTPNAAPRVATPPRDYGVAAATAATTAAFKPQPLAYSPPAPVPSSPATAPAPIPTGATPTAPRLVTPALPTHPDDMALLRETRARDAAARAPEPISIPGGLVGHAMRPGEKPLYPGGPGSGQDSREGQALAAAVNRANGVAPQLAASPDSARLAAEAARTGSVRYVPKGTPEAAAVVSNTGVTRTPATIAPRIAAPPAPAMPPMGDTGYVDQQAAYARPATPGTRFATPSATPTPPPAPGPSLVTTPGALGGPSQVQYTGDPATPDRPRPATNTMFAGVGGFTGQRPLDWRNPAPRLGVGDLRRQDATTAPDPLAGAADSAPRLIPRKKATPLDYPQSQYA